METAWFVLIALMTAGYAVLDGFDLGVGMLLPMMARSEPERAAVRATIGHVWGANEVWLIALGGLLFFAFPRAYAASFSGFYLAFMVLLWCLIGRGLALEVRSKIDDPVWRTATDILLPISSLLIAAVAGTALGNLLRGMPVDRQGQLFLPLWTDFLLPGGPAIFDWYTVLVGTLAVVTLAMHGANYLALRTAGDLRRRAVRLAWPAIVATAGFGIAGFVLTPIVNPLLRRNFEANPAGYVSVGFTAVMLAAVFVFRAKDRDGAAFAASSLFIVGALVTAVYALYPNLLLSVSNPENSLTIHNASAARYGLTVGLVWYGIGMCLVGIYLYVVYRSFWERVTPGSDAY